MKFCAALFFLIGSNAFAALPPFQCGQAELVSVLNDVKVTAPLAGSGYITSIDRSNNHYTIKTMNGYPGASSGPGCTLDFDVIYGGPQGECPVFSIAHVFKTCP